jgi:uncharacterized RDD family membrane protein YckC
MTPSGPPRGDEAEFAQEEVRDASRGDVESRSDGASTDLEPSPGRPGQVSRGLTQNITSTTRTPGPAGLYYADVPNRIIALIIDVIVLGVAGLLLALLLGGLVTRPGALDASGGNLDLVPFLIVMLFEFGISFLYFGYLWVTLRATLGMKMLGLQIGDEADGRSIRWRQAFIRWLIVGIASMLTSMAAVVPSLIGVLLTVVGVAWLLLLLYSIAQSPTKQGLHDRYAHTILVKAGRRVV